MVKKLKKQYETPNEGWSEERIQKEDELIEEYGLKNKKEVYKAESTLRALRREARKLVAEEDETQKQALIEKANSLGLVPEDAHLEDILTLSTTDILDRRLQTAVNRRGYSDTVKEARQMVVHGHIYVDGQRVSIPSYLLTQEEEKEIEVIIPEPSEDESEEAEEGEEPETEQEDVEDTEEDQAKQEETEDTQEEESEEEQEDEETEAEEVEEAEEGQDIEDSDEENTEDETEAEEENQDD